jgi:hypothetical protein
VSEVGDLRPRLRDVDGALVVASNRAAMVYTVDGARDARALAARLEPDPSVEVVLFREGDDHVARRDGAELRFAPNPDGGFVLSGDASVLDHPDALARASAALANPNAGEVLVSAAPGWEFPDLGGAHHRGGGSHGSLSAGDSEVPLLTVGLGRHPTRIVDVAPAVLEHFGVAAPPYALGRAA